MDRWTVERIVHFEAGDLVKHGLSHFGFYDRHDRHFAVFHETHSLGLIGPDDQLEWTVGSRPLIAGVPNIAADLSFPMFVDSLADGSIVVSNLGNAVLYRIEPGASEAAVLVDGRRLGMVDMGNCVVDADDCVWVNEVRGCRVWRFDGTTGATLGVLGNGQPGPAVDGATFANARFNWIYDIRRGPDGDIYVLDSKNFTLRVIDRTGERVNTLAGTGLPGYSGDGGDARAATFGSDSTAQFDGPISLSLDDEGNLFVGDRFNHVVRMIVRSSGVITTVAGSRAAAVAANDPGERDPLRLYLPEISSMDYHADRLFVPTDLGPKAGDLAVLRRQPDPA